MRTYAIFLLYIIAIQANTHLVIELLRHGARGPDKSLPFFQNITWSAPELVGELTKKGIRQHYLLGKYISSKYVDTKFISSTYNLSEIYVQSTDMNRTLMSALSQLNAIYHYDSVLTSAQVNYAHPPTYINNDAQEQLKLYATLDSYVPFVVETKNRSYDMEFSPTDTCPKYRELYLGSVKTKEFIDYVNNGTYGTAAEYFIKYFTLDAAQVMNPENAKPFADNILSAAYDGRLPKDIDQTYVNSMIVAHGFLLNLSTSQTFLANQLANTYLFKLLISKMEEKIKEITQHGPAVPKMRLYALHDTNLLPIINALGITYAGIPVIEFASNMFFELSSTDNPKTKNDFSVILTYNGRYSKTYTFSEFKKACDIYILNDWESQCKGNSTS